MSVTLSTSLNATDHCTRVSHVWRRGQGCTAHLGRPWVDAALAHIHVEDAVRGDDEVAVLQFLLAVHLRGKEVLLVDLGRWHYLEVHLPQLLPLTPSSAPFF